MAKLENRIPRVGNKVVLLRKVFEMPSGTIATVTECDDGIFYRVESPLFPGGDRPCKRSDIRRATRADF